MRLDLADRLESHFPNPKTAQELKCDQLAVEFFLPLEYSIILPKPGDIVKMPLDCIMMYLDAFKYRF